MHACTHAVIVRGCQTLTKRAVRDRLVLIDRKTSLTKHATGQKKTEKIKVRTALGIVKVISSTAIFDKCEKNLLKRRNEIAQGQCILFVIECVLFKRITKTWNFGKKIVLHNVIFN